MDGNTRETLTITCITQFNLILYRHSIKVNKNLLLDLYDHVFHLRIWDGKHKVSPRARFDQPKAFRLPASKKASDSDDESCGARQSTFLKVAQEHSRVSPVKSRVTEMHLLRATDLSNTSLLTSPSPQKFTGIYVYNTLLVQSNIVIFIIFFRL